MTPPWRHPLTLGLVMALVATTLAVMLQPLRKERDFHVPDPAEARRAQAMFRAALADSSGLAKDAERLGLVAGRLDSPPGLSIHEPDGECTGRGAYMLRAAAPGLVPVAIVAPHRGADRDTGPLARLLFEEHAFAAAAWNSAPRRSGADCPHSGDVTREPTHYLTGFSLAFAARFAGGRIVQLHGFDAERRNTQAAREADGIVSDGSEDPSGRLLDFADCLSRRFPDRRIAVYPLDNSELGGTVNAQGRALRETGFAGFTHLELSPEFRRALITDSAARAALTDCLEAGL
jgi:hypothetical protein